MMAKRANILDMFACHVTCGIDRVVYMFGYVKLICPIAPISSKLLSMLIGPFTAMFIPP
jgi:hypothetical protein